MDSIFAFLIAAAVTGLFVLSYLKQPQEEGVARS